VRLTVAHLGDFAIRGAEVDADDDVHLSILASLDRRQITNYS
jgi:hypothetical protein